MPRRGSRVRISSSAPDILFESATLTTSTLTRLAPTRVELEITVTPDELAAAQDRAFRTLAKNVKLPGFRPGKIPRRVFEQTYGDDRIHSQAMEDVVPDVYAKAVREHDLEPVARPEIEMLSSEAAGEPLRFKAVVDVRPEVVLGTYRGLELQRPSTTIGDDDVQRSLEGLARECATLVPVERPAALGDVVTVDYEGTVDGETFEGGTAANQLTELNADRFIPGFATGIAGMSAGDSKVVEAAFPADYPRQELAGKTAQFAVVMHDVKQLELPALDDAFAQSVSKSASIEALRSEVRERLEAIAQARAQRSLGNQSMELLLAAHDIPLPESMIDREVQHMVDEITMAATRNGRSYEDELQSSGKTDEDVRAELRQDATTRVKGTLLIEAIAKAEQITATPTDIATELTALARQYGQSPEQIRASLGSNVVGLVGGIVRTKTIEFLIENAVVVAQEATEPSAS